MRGAWGGEESQGLLHKRAFPARGGSAVAGSVAFRWGPEGGLLSYPDSSGVSPGRLGRTGASTSCRGASALARVRGPSEEDLAFGRGSQESCLAREVTAFNGEDHTLCYGDSEKRSLCLLFLRRRINHLPLSVSLPLRTKHTPPAVLHVHNYFPFFVAHYFLVDFLSFLKYNS